DSDIKEAILLITKQPGTKTTLISPSKKTFTATKTHKDILWHTTDVFDMITLTTPEVGKWQVNLSTKEGNRIYVLTNLRLKSSFDKNFVHKGETLKIDAWLERDGAVITEKDVLDKISILVESKDPKQNVHSARMTPEISEIGATKNNGKYVTNFNVLMIGDYILKIVAEGHTFKREKVFEFKAIEPPQQQPTQKQEEQAKQSEHRDVNAKKSNEWNDALLIFGAVNGAVLLLVLVYFLIKKLIPRLSRKKNKK
ncbi:MAG: hypothetical protein N3A62_09045, partial [Thermodesulfovibrionales bacterium]|nr:hypothetical protein [Thermodesulfovibrionales bacterium]